jgi:outer membrane immunogenic protein
MAAVAVFGFASVAYAAPPAPPVASPSWTGFYIGGNVGAVFNDSGAGTSNFLDTAPLAVAAGVTTNPQSSAVPNKASFLGGGQLGYNWQIACWVVGVEGDFDDANSHYSFCRQTNTSSASCFDNLFGFKTINSKTDWLATARARVGILTSNNLLLYVTGGAAWGSVDTTLSLNCLVDGCGISTLKFATSASSTSTKTGWVAGLGGEMQVTGNWFARLERDGVLLLVSGRSDSFLQRDRTANAAISLALATLNSHQRSRAPLRDAA